MPRATAPPPETSRAHVLAPAPPPVAPVVSASASGTAARRRSSPPPRHERHDHECERLDELGDGAVRVAGEAGQARAEAAGEQVYRRTGAGEDEQPAWTESKHQDDEREQRGGGDTGCSGLRLQRQASAGGRTRVRITPVRDDNRPPPEQRRGEQGGR